VTFHDADDTAVSGDALTAADAPVDEERATLVVAPAFRQSLFEFLTMSLNEMNSALKGAERMARRRRLRAVVRRGVHRLKGSEVLPHFCREVLSGRVETILDLRVPGVHAAVASLADDCGRGAMHDRGAVDVGDDTALLNPVEERHEARLGPPPDRTG
jgi:hypothetical protein